MHAKENLLKNKKYLKSNTIAQLIELLRLDKESYKSIN